MNPDDLPEGITPRQIGDADHRDTLIDADGRRYVVIESALSREKDLINADAIEYEGRLDHPMTGGVIGFVLLLASVLAPLFGGYYLATTIEGTIGTLAVVLAAIVFAWAFGNAALSSRIGDLCLRFLEWNDHKYLIMGDDSA